VPGARLETGERSTLIRQQPAWAELESSLVADVKADRGGNQLSTVAVALVEEWAALRLLTAGQRQRAFGAGSPRSRGRALERYQALLDRLMRLSSLVGLERVALDVPLLSEVLDGD
jgi:hypothetical protein